MRKLLLLLLAVPVLMAAAPVTSGSLDAVTPVDAEFPITEGMTGHVVFSFTVDNLKKQDPPLIQIVCNDGAFSAVGVADEVFPVQAGECEATLFYYHWQGQKQTGPFVLDIEPFEVL